MQFALATLCDAVTVREGLRNILSAGVTRVTHPAYPAPLSFSAVCVVEALLEELPVPRKITVEVRSYDRPDSQPYARIEGGWDALEQDDERLPATVNLIFNLGQVAIPEPGYHEVRIEIDGMEPRVLPFRADLRETTPAE